MNISCGNTRGIPGGSGVCSVKAAKKIQAVKLFRTDRVADTESIILEQNSDK